MSWSAVLTRSTIIYIHTDEILLSLADIYVNDLRFRKIIDAEGGEGTVEFVRRAHMLNDQMTGYDISVYVLMQRMYKLCFFIRISAFYGRIIKYAFGSSTFGSIICSVLQIQDHLIFCGYIIKYLIIHPVSVIILLRRE